MEPENKSILEMVRGGVLERVDVEMEKILSNIADLNTKAAAKRTLIVQVDFVPDENRQQIKTQFVCKSKLEPLGSISTLLVSVPDQNGELQRLEATTAIPGQKNLFGGEQEQPVLLRVVKGA
jgi:hypothetical protein